MKQNVILLAASQYRITDSAGKLENEGCSVRYLLTDDLTPTEDTQRSVKGFVPAKASIPYGDYNQFKTVPGLYEMTMSTRIDSNGKVVMVPAGFNFIGGISLSKSNFGGKAAAGGFGAAKETK